MGVKVLKNSCYAIEKRLCSHLFLFLALYAMIGFAGLLLSNYVLELFPSPICTWISQRLDIFFALYLIIGFCGIFCFYWKKPWRYLNEVMNATEIIYEQNNHAIELSEPLRAVESQMNQIKMSVLLSQQAAKEAEIKKNEMVMYLAHDIRTPLTTVIGYLSLLNEATDMPADQKAKYIGIALDKSERLETLINELFEITRYHTNTVQIEKQSVDLYALLSQVIDDFYPTLSAKGNTTEVSMDDGLTVMGDPEKLARVFNNLLKNAVSYCYANTKICISAKKKNRYAVVIFQNCGPTIPAEQLNSIFDKFNRLDEARTSNTGGAGLGLSIAKEIVNLHGGEITAQSQNEMITFTVTIPLAD